MSRDLNTLELADHLAPTRNNIVSTDGSATGATLEDNGPWKGWARRHSRERWQLLVAGCQSEDDCERELALLTRGWQNKDTYLTDTDRDPNRRESRAARP